MANIVIFSDGTGQRGGLMFDERRSNIYKLFRATRCGPDSSVDPAEQLTFLRPRTRDCTRWAQFWYPGSRWALVL